MGKIKLNVSATVEETFKDFIVSRKIKGLAEKTLISYQIQFEAVARYLDVNMDIAALQKADLESMLISMRDSGLSPNSINSYTRVLKSFFSWCNEESITALNIKPYNGADKYKKDELL
jgi:integrase/recombinase XerD